MKYPHLEYIEIHEPTDEEKLREYEAELEGWSKVFAANLGALRQ